MLLNIYYINAKIFNKGERLKDITRDKYLNHLINRMHNGMIKVVTDIRRSEETHLMENIIYNELRSRGYSVDVGVVEKRGINKEGKEYRGQLEIDFIVNLGSK